MPHVWHMRVIDKIDIDNAFHHIKIPNWFFDLTTCRPIDFSCATNFYWIRQKIPHDTFRLIAFYCQGCRYQRNRIELVRLLVWIIWICWLHGNIYGMRCDDAILTRSMISANVRMKPVVEFPSRLASRTAAIRSNKQPNSSRQKKAYFIHRYIRTTPYRQ